MDKLLDLVYGSPVEFLSVAGLVSFFILVCMIELISNIAYVLMKAGDINN